MTRRKFRVLDSSLDEGTQFDLLIVACGYESRSTHAARRLVSASSQLWAYGYPSVGVHSHTDNAAFLAQVGRLTTVDTAKKFEKALVSDLAVFVSDSARLASAVHIGVDVSSFSREWLGVLMRTLSELGSQTDITVMFLYSVADFDSHVAAPRATVMVNGPLEGFSGWTADPSRPVACLIGLGFENLVALAALETLEPARTIGFVAESHDERFQKRVRNDNASLLKSAEIALTTYDLGQPFAALQDLEGIVHSLLPDFRVVLVPLGPKLFALMSLLVALEYGDDVAVWRVSAGQSAVAEERVAVGPIVTLSVAMA